MTPKQYRAAIAKLKLSQGQAAQFLGISIRTSHAYANGTEIPAAIAKLLRVMLRIEVTPAEVDELK